MGAEIFRKMFVSSKGAKEIAAQAGEQISDEGALVDIVRTVIRENPKAAEDFRRGKKQAAGFFVGQVMKSTHGRANPGLVSKILQRELQVQS
jgi:aspartyl-tRNA(Asn)/glutamyl-tRNA(Gln) amidotransferase subunit B